ncbi:plasma cell-induced resident endoplasmic reticulum protein, partial [Plakobranchus ocellatus]
KAMKSVKANGRLPLADQIEVAEIVCEKKLLGYGLKEARGKKLLSGPGLAGEQLPGVMEAGGKWEARLKTLCFELIEEFEEEGIYNVYTVFGSGGFSQGLCGSYCKGKDEINAVKIEGWKLIHKKLQMRLFGIVPEVDIGSFSTSQDLTLEIDISQLNGSVKENNAVTLILQLKKFLDASGSKRRIDRKEVTMKHFSSSHQLP